MPDEINFWREIIEIKNNDRKWVSFIKWIFCIILTNSYLKKRRKYIININITN